jgi:hypothetical protein
MRSARVLVARIVVRTDARLSFDVWNANDRNAIVHRDAVGAAIRPEVTIERAVLLHDDNDVLDLVDTVAGRVLGCCAAAT